jgi:hypothetical protein
MAQTTHAGRLSRARRRDGASFRLDPRILLAGVIASMAFGMVEMLIEAGIHGFGDGFWSPLKYIAAVFTRGADTDPTFAIGPVIVGLMGHMMNALFLGIVFAYLTRRVRSWMALAAGGMMYGAAVFLVMWYGVLVALDPAMKHVDNTGFFLSHLVYGGMLGIGIAVARGGVSLRGRDRRAAVVRAG